MLELRFFVLFYLNVKKWAFYRESLFSVWHKKPDMIQMIWQSSKPLTFHFILFQPFFNKFSLFLCIYSSKLFSISLLNVKECENKNLGHVWNCERTYIYIYIFVLKKSVDNELDDINQNLHGGGPFRHVLCQLLMSGSKQQRKSRSKKRNHAMISLHHIQAAGKDKRYRTTKKRRRNNQCVYINSNLAIWLW